MRKLQLFLFWILMFLVYQLTKLVIVLDRKFKFKLKFPRDIDQLKLQKNWCIQTLIANGALPKSLEVVDFQVRQLKQDVVFRSDTALVTIDYKQDGDNHQFKCIAKFAPTLGSVASRAIFNLQQNHIKEVSFYKHLAEKMIGNKVAPKVYFKAADKGTGNMCLLMEYMEDYKEFDEIEGCPEQLIPTVITHLGQMHASFWKVKDKEVEGIVVIPRIVSDLLESTQWFKWSNSAIAVFRKCWERNNEDQTVIHGDARVGNYLFHKEDPKQLVFIDWQGCRLSKSCVDLAYFLILSIQKPLRIEQEEKMLKLYYDTLISNGVENYSEATFRNEYNDACIMVLTMLAMPGLSGEGNYDTKSDSVMFFVFGYYYWHDRLKAKMDAFDYDWMAQNYDLSKEESKRVIAELLEVYSSNFMNIFESMFATKQQADDKFNELHDKLKGHYKSKGLSIS